MARTVHLPARPQHRCSSLAYARAYDGTGLYDRSPAKKTFTVAE